jgi:ABC-type molybdenum transport system ATPase subunit/photorepair protein PhrA
MGTLLAFNGVDAGYSGVKILKDLSFEIEEGS